MQIEFRVPLTPPGINHLWRSRGNGKGNYKIAAAEVFTSAVFSLAPKHWQDVPESNYEVELIFGIEAKRFNRCDCDNFVKVAMDALQHSGIIRNDSNVIWFSAGKVKVEGLRDEFTKYLVRTV